MGQSPKYMIVGHP